MQVSTEVLKWLREHAYAVKDGQYWFLSDFPTNLIPEKLEIPIRKRGWTNFLAKAVNKDVTFEEECGAARN